MSRLCLVCVSLRAGGTERIVSRIANYLSQRYEVTLVLLSFTEPFYSLLPEVRVVSPNTGRRSQVGWRWYPQMLYYLWYVFGQVRPNLVLSFGETIAPVVLPMARLRGSRTLVFNRASPLTSIRGRRGLLNRLAYPLAHGVVVQTFRSLKLLQRHYQLSRFHVWPNPIDVPSAILPLGQRKNRIITVGTLGGKKNQQALICAFAGIENRDGWSLELVGEGPNRPTLERLSSELGVRDSIRFLGQRQDVNDLLADAQIFAFSSLTEGFPNALAEALAAGCACISYDCPTGPSELINDGVNGFLVPLGNEMVFAQRLQQLMDDEQLRARFSAAARASITRFEAGSIMQALEAILGLEPGVTERT